MTLRSFVAGIAAVLFLAAPAAGQEFVMEVLDDGKPVEDVTVRDGDGDPVGTTDAGGRVAFDMSVLDLGKGDRVEVWLRRCTEEGTVEIVLIPQKSLAEGETGREACMDEDAGAGEDCECEEKGFFVVGDGPVIVDITTGRVSTVSRPLRRPQAEAYDRWRLDAGVELSYFANWEDVACSEQLGDGPCDTGPWAYGFFGEIGYRHPGWPVGIGVDVAYGMNEDVERTFSGGSVVAETDFLALTPFVRLEPKPWLDFVVGPQYVYNYTTIDGRTITLEPVRIDREDGNWNVLGRVGARYPLRDDLYVKSRAGFSTGGGSEDADSNIVSLRLGLEWTPHPNGGGR
ncbi:MAG: hypothetical protein R3199_10775 [Gemmatimonadota bacterium]|nr:hypothetical protein [Gemmatimonadota bacterium]